MSNEKLYYPYNFIPVTATVNGSPVQKLAYDYASEKDDASARFARHDLHAPGTLSGRILCSLTTKSALVTGNLHTPEAGIQENPPTWVTQYQWRGEAAIAGNSLRGLVASTVEIISQSSLRVLSEDFQSAFETIDKDLIPWNPDRNRPEGGLTPAESLFGVVEQEKDHFDHHNETTANLASRVRFADAVLSPEHNPGAVCHDPVYLQIQESPRAKPDKRAKDSEAVNHYFLDDNDGQSLSHIKIHEALTNPHSKLKLRGRGVKVRMPDSPTNGLEDFKNTANTTGNRSRCEPVKSGTTFYFHIDFENLTIEELSLLQASIDLEQGLHKLGMGKNLGMGLVDIKILSFFFIEAEKRYSVDCLEDTSKYSSQWRIDKDSKWKSLQRYQNEQRATSQLEKQLTWKIDLIDKESLNIVQLYSDASRKEPGIPTRWRPALRRGKFNVKDLNNMSKLPVPQGNDSTIPYAELGGNEFAWTPSAPKPKGGFIITPNEKLTNAIVWIRLQIEANTGGKFDDEDFDVAQIGEELVLPGLCKKWVDIEDLTLKREIAQAILDGANAHDTIHEFTNGNRKRIKAGEAYRNFVDSTKKEIP